MPYAINEELLSTKTSLDIANPPVMSIPHQEFPKMVYLHPKDKTREHATKIVHSASELEAAKKQGWRPQPHVPVAVDPVVDSGEFEIKPAI